MKYAIIKNGKVSNVVVAEPEYAAQKGWVECPEGVGIGWAFDGAKAIPPLRDFEYEWNMVRSKRNQLLSESDAYVLPDRWAAMTEEKQAEWSKYREDLRNIPQDFSDPKEVIWPVKP